MKKKPNIFKAYERIFPTPSSLVTMVRILMFPKLPDGSMSEKGLFLTWKPSDGNFPNFIQSVMTTISNPQIDYAYCEYLSGKTALESFTLKGTVNSPHLVQRKTKDFRK